MGTYRTFENFEDSSYNFNFSTPSSAEASWGLSTAQFYEGATSFKSGTITHNQQAEVEFTVTVPSGAVDGSIQMYYKISSEANYDYIRIYVNGSQVHSDSGEKAWQLWSRGLGSGSHTIKIAYTKDGSVNTYGDCAYIDALEFSYYLPTDITAVTQWASPRDKFDITVDVAKRYDYIRSSIFYVKDTSTGTNVYSSSLVYGTNTFTVDLASSNTDHEIYAEVEEVDEVVVTNSDGTTTTHYYFYTTSDREYTSYYNRAPSASTSSFNGSVSAPTETLDSTPTFTWTYSDPDGDSHNGSELVVESLTRNWSATYTATGTATSYTDATALQANDKYRWHVRVRDYYGDFGGYSGWGHFNVVGLPTSRIYSATPQPDGSVLVEGAIKDDGCGTISSTGFCWATTSAPTTANSTTGVRVRKEQDRTSAVISGLAKDTTYYIRPYTTNQAGTSYGAQITFSIPSKTISGRLGEELEVRDEVLERIPQVENGLSAYIPFDYTDIGKRVGRNILDYSSWTLGTTGNGNGWSMSGENTVILKENPWGEEDVVLASMYNDATSDYDGGWTNFSHSIDSTKKYRLSMWLRRENAGNGRTYFGCQANTVCNLGGTTVNGNPYFGYPLASDCPEMVDNWVLFVAYIHPSSYTGGTDSTTGIYTIDGKKVTSYNLWDYKWEAGETVGGHRSYLYYSTSEDERQFWYQPRFEICDGSELSIDELCRGVNGDSMRPVAQSNVIFMDDGISVNEAGTNLMNGIAMTKDGHAGVTHGEDEKGLWFSKDSNAAWYTGLRIPNISVESGKTYTFTMEVMCDKPFNTRWDYNVTAGGYSGNDAARHSGSSHLYSYTTPGKWQKVGISITVHGDASSPVAADSFCPDGSAYANYKIYYRNPVLEQKEFPTTYDINRKNDASIKYAYALSVPSSISLRYYIDNKVDVGNRKYLFSFENDNSTSNYFALYHSDGEFVLTCASSYASIFTVKYANNLSDGFHTFTATLESTGMKLYIDGVEVGSSGVSLPSATMYLKVGSGPNINLLRNGSAEMSNNGNFTGFNYSSTDSSDGDSKSFYISSGSTTRGSDDYMPVDPSKRYRLEGDFKAGDDGVQSNFYYGLFCYDENKSFIGHQEVTHYSNTRTTLAQDLVDGATTVYLTSAANWVAGTAGSTAYNKLFATWPSGWRYPNYTRSKHAVNYLTVDTTANTITLQNAWNGGTLPAGTPVANSMHGGTYNYIAASNALTTTSWTRYSGEIQGLGGGSGGVFRWGTRYVRLMFLLNRNATSPTTKIDNMAWYELNSNQTANSPIKDVAIYKRVLSNDEIRKLAGGNFSIQKDGELISSGIVEKPNKISEDGYLQLGDNSKNVVSNVTPITETNTVHEGNSTWVGQGTTNRWTGSTYSWSTGLGSITRNVSSIGAPVPNVEVIKLESHGDGAYRNIPWTVGGILTPGYDYYHSVYAYLESGSYVGIGQHWNPWTSSDSQRKHIPKRQWVRISVPSKTDHTSNTSIALEYCTDGVAYFCAPQYEQRNYLTPFVNGTINQTRGATDLHYPWDIINLSQDFTVCGWWKPQTMTNGTYNPAITYNRRSSNYTYRRLLIMESATSAGSNQLRAWISNGSGEIYAYGPSSPGIQLDKWNFFAFVKTGTTTKLWHGVDNSIWYGQNSSGGTYLNTLWNGADTNGDGVIETFLDSNWGWLIGEYDSGSTHTGNSHHRDYVFAQHALTDAEVEKIYRTQMRAYKKGGLQIQSGIVEGKIF